MRRCGQCPMRTPDKSIDSNRECQRDDAIDYDARGEHVRHMARYARRRATPAKDGAGARQRVRGVLLRAASERGVEVAVAPALCRVCGGVVAPPVRERRWRTARACSVFVLEEAGGVYGR